MKAISLRLILTLAVVLAAFGFPSRAFSSNESAQITVEPASVEATTCALQTISIRVADVVDLTGYHLEIVFDPAVIHITQVVNGDFLDGAVEDAFYEPTNTIDNVTGFISFGMVQQNTEGDPLEPKSGEGDLILITVEALTPNQTTVIDIDDDNSMLVDWPDAFEIAFEVTDGEVVTESCAPTDIDLSKALVPENQPVGTQVGVLASTDPDLGDSFTYSLVDEMNYPDNLAFSIDGNILKTNAVFDYEMQAAYTILIRTTDGGGKTFDKAFTVDVEDLNESPAAVDDTYSTLKNHSLVVPVPGVLTNDTDPENDSLSAYKITNPPSGEGVVVLGSDGSLSYHPPTDWIGTTSFTYQAFDGEFYSNTATVTIHVNESNQAPTDIVLDDNLLPENAGTGAVVGLMTSVDPDLLDTHIYTLVAGTGDEDNALFSISGSQLIAAVDFNFEVQNEYSVRIRTTDQGSLSFEKVFTIIITDVNDPPVAYDLEVITDEDIPVSFTITGFDEDGDDFEFVLLTNPEYGSVPWTPPDLTYSPDIGFEVLDYFQFKVIDEHDISSSLATVSIVANPKAEILYYFPIFIHSGKLLP